MPGPGRIAEFRHVPGQTVARLFNFDVAQDRLKPEHQTWLRENVEARLRKGGSLWIMGLTSTTGSEALNTPLSQKRANSVVAFLRKELSKDFPVKVDVNLGLGKKPARLAGLGDNTEDDKWRGVVIGVWDKPVPPPPPPPPPVQEECRRVVIEARDGVTIYVPYSGRGVIEQVWKVKASPDYIKCATDFEREWSFLANPNSHPVVSEQLQPGSNVVGEVVGHYIQSVYKIDIVAESNALSNALRSAGTSNKYSLSLDDLLNGATWAGPGADKFVTFPKVALYVSRRPGPQYTQLAPTSEDAPSYVVVTDVVGQILLVMSENPSKYPKSDSNLKIGVKTVVNQTVKVVVKSLLFP